MGYVVLGLGVWSSRYAGTQLQPRLLEDGRQRRDVPDDRPRHQPRPACSSCVGVIYDRVHHRNLDEFGGMFAKMPVYSGLAFGIFFAGLGLPGLCGFIGEVFVVAVGVEVQPGAGRRSPRASAVILTAAYILWTLQRVYLGPEYKGPHGEHLHPMTPPRARDRGCRFCACASCSASTRTRCSSYMAAERHEDRRRPGRLDPQREHPTATAPGCRDDGNRRRSPDALPTPWQRQANRTNRESATLEYVHDFFDPNNAGGSAWTTRLNVSLPAVQAGAGADRDDRRAAVGARVEPAARQRLLGSRWPVRWRRLRLHAASRTWLSGKTAARSVAAVRNSSPACSSSTTPFTVYFRVGPDGVRRPVRDSHLALRNPRPRRQPRTSSRSSSARRSACA